MIAVHSRILGQQRGSRHVRIRMIQGSLSRILHRIKIFRYHKAEVVY